MNESILKALIRLFAIIAHVDEKGVSQKARDIVKSYLSLMLNKKHIIEYLNLFDEFVEKHHNIKNRNRRKARKRTSVNSVKVLMICNDINEQLNQEEKLIVLVRLFEFIGEDNIITNEEIDFVQTVADVFNIVVEEYLNIKLLIIGSIDEIKDKTRVLILDKNKKNKIGFRHLFVNNLNGSIKILYVKSTNIFIFRYDGADDLFLNGQNIIPHRIYIFDSGSVIKSSKISPVYHSDIAGDFVHSFNKTKIILKAKDIEFRYKNTENGIHKFSFCEHSGRLIGIMGGSGVGKSTFLNVLNGNFPLYAGKITINGYDIHNNNNKNELKGVIGFVPQDDLLIEELTVYQNLYYNAKLCFSNFSEEKTVNTVNKVLYDLDLDTIKNLTVGNSLNKFISGGQRKRLNIALELMREPSILIVDEPTSGLSSMDSEMVMTILKQQTLKGKLVIVNIHQPSSDIYKLFDSLVILDRGGYPVYYGNPVAAISYFKKSANYVNAEEGECSLCGNANPEQPLQILEAKMVDEYGKYTKERKVNPKEWYSEYIDKIAPGRKEKCNNDEKPKLPQNYFKIPSLFKQFVIFTKRNIRAKLTNKQYLLITFLEAPLLAIILGYFTKYISGTDLDPDAYVFAENINLIAYLFMAVTVALFLGMTISAEEIIKDRKIIKREKFLNLSRFSYLNSKIFVLFIISAIQTFSFIVVGNFILDIKEMTLTYWLILFSTAAFANILGLNISSTLDSVVTIYIVIPFILVPQLLFSGVIVDFTKLHKNFTSYKYVPFIGDIMTSRWAYEALVVAQFKGNRFEKNFFEIDKKKSDVDYRLSYLVPKLETRLNTCLKNINKNENNQQSKRYFLLVTNEILKLQKETNLKFENINKLNIKDFNKDIYKSYKKFSLDLKRYYNKKKYEINIKSDKILKNLVKKYGSKEKIYQLQANYQNKKILDILKNKIESIGIKESEGELIQVIDPIFKDPEARNGRAHFYSHIKQIGDKKFDTVWFNIIFIWFTSLFIYITLIFDILRKLIGLPDKIRKRTV